jgi:hypothetical protein
MPSHKDKRKEKKRKKEMAGGASGGGVVPEEPLLKKQKKHNSEHAHIKHAVAAPRKAQALGAWNPKATLVKGAKMDENDSTSLLLFYQYIQPLWTEVCFCAHEYRRLSIAFLLIIEQEEYLREGWEG